jgi:hypothetical protein
MLNRPALGRTTSAHAQHATYRGRANILKRPNRLNVRSGSVAGPPPCHPPLVKIPTGVSVLPLLDWTITSPVAG